jgi:hypothetical protein
MQILRVLNNQYNPGKNWSQRNKTSSKFKILIRKIKNFLNLMSGFDLLNMIKDLLTEEELLIISQKYVAALSGLANTVNKRVTMKEKHDFIRPLRLADLTLSNIKDLGFNCGKELWKNCLDERPRLPGGRPVLDENIQTEIENHMETITSFAANRTIKERVIGPYLPIHGRYHGIKKPKIKRLMEKSLITVRNRYSTLREAKTQFDEKYQLEYGRKIPYQTFLKYIHKKYKRPKRISDLCMLFLFKKSYSVHNTFIIIFLGNYCENGKNIKKEIQNLLNQYPNIGLSNHNEFNTNEYLRIVSQKRSEDSTSNELKTIIEQIIKKLKDLKEIEYHKSIADRQKKTYNLMIKDINSLENKIIIEVFFISSKLFYKNVKKHYLFLFKIDFKQKIVYGMSPRATNNQWYNQKQASCLGFGIYYKNETSIKCLNIDIISDCLEQDANAVIRAFEFVRNLDIFQKFKNIKNYIIWSDCGNILL